MADAISGQFYLVSDVAEVIIGLPGLARALFSEKPRQAQRDFWVLCFTQLLSLMHWSFYLCKNTFRKIKLIILSPFGNGCLGIKVSTNDIFSNIFQLEPGLQIVSNLCHRNSPFLNLQIVKLRS